MLFATGPEPGGTPDAHEVDDLGASGSVRPEPLAIAPDIANLVQTPPADLWAPDATAEPAPQGPDLVGGGFLAAPLLRPEPVAETDGGLFAASFMAAPLRRSEAELERWLLSAGDAAGPSRDELIGAAAGGFRPAPLDRLVGRPGEIECLALNIYFEARGEALDGRRAVGDVTMNRVLDPDFPDTVCGVVRQGAIDPRKKGCQFSWWCDGRSDRPVDPRAWADSYQLALEVYWDRSRDLTRGALWFHADYVTPDWAEVFDRGPQIGRHLFYSRPDPLMEAPVEPAPIIEVETRETLDVESLEARDAAPEAAIADLPWAL